MEKANFLTKSIKNKLRNFSLFGKVYAKLHFLKSQRITNKVITELKSFQDISEKNLSKKQNEKLIETLLYVYKNTTYYKDIFDKNGVNPIKINDFKKIPFLTKEKIRENITSLISREYQISDLGKKNTGGSTGEPLEFYSTTKAGLIDYGHHWYLYSLMGYKKEDIIVGCGGLKIHEDLRKKNVYWVKKNKGNVFGDYMFSVLYLTKENVGDYVKKLIQIRPAILRGYPSFYDSLAQYILNNDIKLDFKIKGINLTAEMCSLNQRTNIEKAFNAMVYFEYGHSEVSLYCYTSDNTYIYRSSPIYGFIEVLNDDGSETKIGDVGNIVTTGLINKGMPLIRYRTGDLGELKYKNGGIVHFSKIYGRSQDYILSKNNEKVYLTALIFGQHLKAFSNIVKWQIIQNEIGKITISVLKGRNYSKEDETDIINKITNVTEVEISFDYVNDIPRTKRGKHLFLVQNIRQ